MSGTCKAKVWDVMLMQHLCFPDLPHDLEFIGSQFSNKPAWKDDRGNFQLYNARDVDVTLQCYSQLRPMLRMNRLEELYKRVSVPLALICRKLFDTGVKVDPAKAVEVREQLLKEIAGLEGELPEELKTFVMQVSKRVPAPEGTLSEKTKKPVKFLSIIVDKEITPWRSPSKVEKWLYESVKAPVQLHVKTQEVTTDKTALDKIVRRFRKEGADEKARWVDALRRIKKADKLAGSFVTDALAQASFVYPHFNVHGTNSGRLSSSDPNLQNVPESARYVYVASRPGWRIVEADYSQIENRLTAYFAQDTERLGRFLRDSGFSEHKWAASQFFGIPYDEVEKDNDKEAPYGKAKRIVHGPLAEGTEVLTPHGWLRVEDFEEGTPIAQWKDGVVRFIAPRRRVTQHVDEELLDFRGRAFKALVTEDHRFPTKNWRGDFKHVPAGDLNENYRIPVSGVFGFGTLEADVRLAAALQADGSLYGRYGVFHLVKERKKKRLEAILGNRAYKKEPCGCHPNGTRYRLPAETVEPALWILTEKGFNANVLELTKELAEVLLEEVTYWDGSRKRACKLYFSTDKTSVEWLQILAHLLGMRGHLTTRQCQGFGHKLFYVLSLSKKKFVRCPEEIVRTPYRGNVYCFETDDGAFLFRYHDSVAVSSNSNYGMGAQKISNLYDMPLAEVKELLAKWKGKCIPATVEWQERIAAQAKKDGFLRTPFGRMRWFYTSSIYTESLSFLPQSTAADIIFRAMIGMYYDRVGWPAEEAQAVVSIIEPLPWPAQLLLTVHDSLVVECPPEDEQGVVAVMKRVMEQPFKELGGFSCPISVGSGDSWGSAE